MNISIAKSPDIRERADLSDLSLSSAEKVLSFHQSFPMYQQTPLINLKQLAKELCLGEIYVKDESYRFSLNAFKVLGGSYAIGNYIADRLGMDISELSFNQMISDETKAKIGDITFVTATDGNHGRGVAWTANRLRQKSVVYMPKGSSQERLANIKAEGADASITEYNYDGAVRFANDQAKKNDWVMVQDTAWDGYEDIPRWIMQGYATMGIEAYHQMKKRPTHIFLQAGVGSMAAAVTGFFSSVYKDNKPIIVIVEADAADCIYKTAKAADGKIYFVTGDMNTIMAGLACGEPCTIAWPILQSYADFFVSCSDDITEKGMRLLGHPVGDDAKIISGESGAVTIGLVAEIIKNKDFAHIREMLQLDGDSELLCISSEGSTDLASYNRIVDCQ